MNRARLYNEAELQREIDRQGYHIILLCRSASRMRAKLKELGVSEKKLNEMAWYAQRRANDRDVG